MDDKLVKEIDSILVECSEKDFISLTKSTPPETRKAINVAEIKNLIKKKSSYTYQLTDLGFDVISKGGYRKYFDIKESEKEIDEEIKKLTIKELKGNIFHLKYWWIILIINIILSGIISYTMIILTK